MIMSVEDLRQALVGQMKNRSMMYYLEAGLSEDETVTMLDIAAQVDYGTFEGAGFSFHAETGQARLLPSAYQTGRQ